MAPRNTVSSISATLIPDCEPTSNKRDTRVADAMNGGSDQAAQMRRQQEGGARGRRDDADARPKASDTFRNLAPGQSVAEVALCCRRQDARHNHTSSNASTSMATRLATR